MFVSISMLDPSPTSSPVRLVHRDIAAYLVAQGHAVYLDHPDNLDGQVECAMLAPSRNAMRPRPRPVTRVARESR